MTQASALRSFATTAEFVAGLMPKLVLSRAVSKAEATLLTQQLRRGAEIALDIALRFDAAERTASVCEKDLQVAAAAMLNSPAWPAVFRAGTAEVLARAALTAGRATTEGAD